jgi:hypothetical protein
MAKKRPAKKTAARSKRTETKPEEEQIVLGPNATKALRLVDKSAKARAELEEAVTLALAKVVRKVMKDNKIELTPSEADVLSAIWFGD